MNGDVKKPIPVKEAVQLVMEQCEFVGTETVSLHEAYGRVLAEPIIAEHDVPPFNRSAYDGYAIRAEDWDKCERKIGL